MRLVPHYLTRAERAWVVSALRSMARSQARATARLSDPGHPEPERLLFAASAERCAAECNRIAGLFDNADMVDVYPLAKN
jgi:hypothetical protein